jgi:ribonucleoside-diphosphate reductase alpha chain
MADLSAYQSYIHLSRYARWDDAKKRRETWEETVQRYINFFSKRFPDYPSDTIRAAIQNLEVMPSMRCLMTAGAALDRDEIARV